VDDFLHSLIFLFLRMYNNSQGFRSNGRPRSFSRSQSSSRSAGPRRFSGSRRFSGRRRSQSLDYTKFIKKASPKKIEEYTPIHKFIDFNISDALKQNIIAKQYEIPTPIQDQTIPHIIEGKDLIGIANTGTGKTAAFLIPLINKVQNDRAQKVLIMVPTRELACQIYDEFRSFSGNLGLFATTVIGGESIYRQIQSL
jgi:superfamily II DNA/RNA helicase